MKAEEEIAAVDGKPLPEFAQYNNVGMVLMNRGDYTNAFKVLAKAHQLNPESPIVLDNLASCIKHGGDIDGAIELYGEAIQKDPEYEKAWSNLSILLLGRRDWVNGWRYYRNRFKAREKFGTIIDPISGKPMQDVPVPTPAQIRGKRVVIVDEQGLGDELFFLRFLHRLWAYEPASIEYTPQYRLLELIAGDPPGVDFRPAYSGTAEISVALADLPLLTNHIDPDDCPRSIDISVPGGKFMRLKSALERFPRPWIGLQWRSGVAWLKHRGGIFKDVPFDSFWRAAENLPGTRVILQRGLSQDETAGIQKADRVLNLSGMADDLGNCAALMRLLDQYITVSNTNVHIAAGLPMGVKPRVLVPWPPEWRWTQQGDESPWFPGYQVFRQGNEGDWAASLANAFALPSSS